jgi:hypothetical protein
MTMLNTPTRAQAAGERAEIVFAALHPYAAAERVADNYGASALGSRRVRGRAVLGHDPEARDPVG